MTSTTTGRGGARCCLTRSTGWGGDASVVGDDVLGSRFQSAADYDVVLEIGGHLLEVLIITGDNEGDAANSSNDALYLLFGEGPEFLKPRRAKDVNELSEESLRGHEVEILLGDSRP